MSLFRPNETGTLIVPPRIQAMMSAVKTVFAIHPRYRLTYIDGETEEAILDDSYRDADFLRLVSGVQSAARK